MSVQIILKNSKVEDKRPTAEQLTNGEPSLNYNEAGAFLCCKDTDGNIQQIGGIKISDDAPGTPVKGTLWFQPSTSRLYIHNGTTWLTATSGGGGGGGGGGAVDQIIAGDGIDVTPFSGDGIVTLDADIDENRGLEFVGGKIAVKLGAGIEFDPDTGALNVAVDGLTYKGTVDLTTPGDVPAEPTIGDAYANTGDGDFDAEWISATGEPAGANADPGDLVVWNGTVWTFIPTGGGGGGTASLTYVPTVGDTPAVGGTVASVTGTDAEIPMAGYSQSGVLGDAAQAGLMSPTDKTKLDSIEDGAEANVGTDLVYVSDGDNAGTVESSTGTDAIIPIATDTDAGLFTAAEKEKLEGIEAGAQVNVDIDVDLGYTAAADKGTVTNTAGDDAELPLANATDAGLMSPEDFNKLLNSGNLNVGNTPPLTPDIGDIWVDTSECPPEIKIWNDCEDPGSPDWISIGGGIPKITFTAVITDDGTPQGNEVGSVLTASAISIQGGLFPEEKSFQWYVDGVVDVTTKTMVIEAADIGKQVTCDITCAEPDGENPVTITATYLKTPVAVAIDFTALINDDGTTTGNRPGSVLTATADDITGGTAPVESGYQWYANGVADVVTKTRTILSSDVGKTITCDITCAEPDGENPVTKLATYDKTPGVVGSINKPIVLTPPNGSGLASGESGGITYTPKTSAITDVKSADYSSTISSDNGGTVTVGGKGAFAGNDTYADSHRISSPGLPANPIMKWINKAEWDLTGDLSVLVQQGNSDNAPGQLSTVKVYDSGGALERTFDVGVLGSAGAIYVDIGQVKPDGYFIYERNVGEAATATFYAMKMDGEYVIEADSYIILTNSNTYNNADGSLMSAPISTAFAAGDTVKGQNATGVYGADAPAFSTTLYVGTGAANEQLIETGIDNLSKSMLWLKNRDSVSQHFLYDTERGSTSFLNSDTSDPVTINSNIMTGFTSNGFKVADNQINIFNENQVAWNFRAAPGFLDIVTYTGTGVAGLTIPHSLGSTPGFVIVKRLDAPGEWRCYHSGLTSAEYVIMLDQPEAESVNSMIWNSTDPTDSVFSVGTNSNVNADGGDYVAYLFADTPGKIKCGSFTGTETLDLGFRLGWIMLKRTDNTGNWIICDSTRGFLSLSENSPGLYPNNSFAEAGGAAIEVTDTTATINGYDGTYIYVAIAENVVAGEMPPTGTLTADADDAGPTITLTDVLGTWEDGMEIVNDKELTEFGPSADVLEFTSSVPSGTSITTYGSATWEVDTDSSFGSPMTATKTITAGVIQELLPSERGGITLADDTEYHVRVKYGSADPAGVTSVYSDANHFQTRSAARTTDPSFLAYDADNNQAVNDLDIVDRFGVDPTANNTRLGIHELTEQPTGAVAAYVPEGDKYKPIIDLSEPLEQAQAEAAQANARLDEANATIEEIRADFEARIAALENP